MRLNVVFGLCALLVSTSTPGCGSSDSGSAPDPGVDSGAPFEGAFDLDFDEICNAYAVTMISGPDYLRQLTPDGTFTEWNSTTNLNMGQVAVLRALAGEFKVIGDIAATYICCATCGCIETGAD